MPISLSLDESPCHGVVLKFGICDRNIVFGPDGTTKLDSKVAFCYRNVALHLNITTGLKSKGAICSQERQELSVCSNE